MKVGSYTLNKTDFKFQLISKGKVRINLDCIHSSSNKLMQNIDELKTVSKTYFLEIIDRFCYKYESLLDNIIDLVGELDFIQSCAFIADKFNYVKPIIDTNKNNTSYIKVSEIRHPIIEQINQDVPYIANDIELGTPNKNGMLLFGVNAVGKK